MHLQVLLESPEGGQDAYVHWNLIVMAGSPCWDVTLATFNSMSSHYKLVFLARVVWLCVELTLLYAEFMNLLDN